MAGVRRRAPVVGVAVATLLLATPSPLTAAGHSEAVTLADSVTTEVVTDLDGDGARDLVAVVSAPDGTLTLDAWTLEAGAWQAMGPRTIQAGPGAESPAADPGRDGVGLVALRDGEGERVLVLVAPDVLVSESARLTISEVTLEDGHLRLASLGADLGPAHEAWPIDIDGDGRDELLLARTPRFGPEPVPEGGTTLTILRPTENGIAVVATFAPDVSADAWLQLIGDTDGVPGEEVVFVDLIDSALVRVAFGPSGSPVVDRLEADRESIIQLDAAADGLLLFTDTSASIALARWPRGGDLVVEHRRAIGGWGAPAMLIGSEADLRVVVIESSGSRHGPIHVLDRSLEEEAVIEVTPVANELAALASAAEWSVDLSLIYPHMGPIPFGLGRDVAAASVAGSLVHVGADGSLQVDPSVPFFGSAPIGAVGPGDAWLAVRNGWPARPTAFLMPIGPIDAPLRVVPLAAVAGEAAVSVAPGVTIERRGGVPFVRRGRPWVAARDGGLAAVIDGPPGSRAIVSVARDVDLHELGDGPLEVDLRVRDSAERNRSVEIVIVVVTPSGHGVVERWQARFVREPPALSAEARTVDGRLEATVSGTVEQTGGELLVDGRPVAPAADGTFSVEVGAPIWPRTVDVLARDAVGNEALVRVDVVGLVDYRGWPLLPAAAVAIVLAGVALLFRRPPRPVAERPAVDGDGTLEEIIGD